MLKSGSEVDVPSAGKGTFSVTEEVRRAAALRKAPSPNSTVRVATLENLKDILRESGEPALLVAHSNGCGHCRALVETLADATAKLQTAKDMKPRILMFETSKAANRAPVEPFDSIEFVPDFFVAALAPNGSLRVSKWSDASQVTASRNANGEYEKNIPFAALQKIFQPRQASHTTTMRALGFQ
jgi:hypothetical protein